jgi:protein TonB
MRVRSGSYLIPSLMMHGAFFAALASVPVSAEPSAVTRAIEFMTISEEGGGRLGDDEQIGDAEVPAPEPERLFREVRPKPKPKAVRRAPAAKVEAEPDPIEPSAGETEATAGATPSDSESSHATSQSLVKGSAGTDPNGRGSGTGGGGEGVDRRSALRAWLSQVQREVNKIATRNYPSSAVRRRLEGRLRLGVTIGPDGRIVAVRVLSSSGHPVLDDSATASVTSLHIPPPPDDLRWREREISLPIRYALD